MPEGNRTTIDGDIRREELLLELMPAISSNHARRSLIPDIQQLNPSDVRFSAINPVAIASGIYLFEKLSWRGRGTDKITPEAEKDGVIDIDKQQIELDLSAYDAGIYFVDMLQNQESRTFKVIKQ